MGCSAELHASLGGCSGRKFASVGGRCFWFRRNSSVYNGIESIEANFYIALNISDYVKKKKKKKI